MRLRWVIPIALLFGLAWWYGRTVRLEQDPLRLLPSSVPEIAAWAEMLERFGEGDAIIIDVGDEAEPFSRAVERVARKVAEDLPAEGVADVALGRFSLATLSDVRRLLHEHRAALFSRDVMTRARERTTPRAIRERVLAFRRSLALIPDPTTVERFREDPLAIDDIYLDLLPRPAEVGTETALVDGWVWTKDGLHLLLVAVRSSSGPRSAKDLVREIERILDRALRAEGESRVRVAFFCAQRAAVDNEAMVRNDMRRSLLLSMLLVAGILRLGVSTWRMLPPLFLSPLVGLAAGVLVAGAVYGSVSPLVAGAAAILVGLSVDYAVHVARALAGAGDRDRAIAAIRRPIFVAAGTTGAAFSALLLSAFSGHRQLGVVCGAGVVAAALFSLAVLPRLGVSGAEGGRVPVLDRWLRRWRVGSRAPARPLVWIAFLSVVGIAGIPRVDVDMGLARFNAMSGQTRRDVELLARTWGAGRTAAGVLVEGRDLEDVLGATGRVSAFLRDHHEELEIEGVADISKFLPARKVQAENRHRWEEFWNRERLGQVRRSLRTAMDEAGFSPGFLGDDWEEGLRGKDSWLTLEEVEETGLAWVTRQWLACDREGCVSRVMFHASRPSILDRVEQQTRRSIGRGRVASGARAIDAVSHLAIRELLRVGACALLLVIGVLFMRVRERRLLLALACVPALTLLWTFGAMGWLGVPLTLVNNIVVVFVFGIAIDYGVFLVPRWKGHVGVAASVHGGVLVCAATTMAGFAALATARHPALRDVGLTAALAIGTGLMAAWLVAGVVAPGRTSEDA